MQQYTKREIDYTDKADLAQGSSRTHPGRYSTVKEISKQTRMVCRKKPV